MRIFRKRQVRNEQNSVVGYWRGFPGNGHGLKAARDPGVFGHLRRRMGLFVQGQGSIILVSLFWLRIFCDCDSSDSAEVWMFKVWVMVLMSCLMSLGFVLFLGYDWDIFGIWFIFQFQFCYWPLELQWDIKLNTRSRKKVPKNRKLKAPTNYTPNKLLLKIKSSRQQIAFLSKSPAACFTWLSKSLLLLLLAFC